MRHPKSVALRSICKQVTGVTPFPHFYAIAFSGAIARSPLSFSRSLGQMRMPRYRLAASFAQAMDCHCVSSERPYQYRSACYELMSMGQVIIIPPTRGEVAWYWLEITKAGLALLVVIQLCILAYDMPSRGLGCYSAHSLRLSCLWSASHA